MTSPKSIFLAIILGLALLPAVSSAQFTDSTNGPLGTTGTSFGVAWGDCDGDGDFDLFFTQGSSSSKLLRNDGSNSFTDMTTAPLGGAGADAGAAWGDIDNDNDLDLFVANAIGPSRLLRNDSGQFVDILSPAAAGAALAQSAAWADYDNDGDLDLYVSYWGAANRLLRNEGGGTFLEATPPALAVNSKSTGVAWGDFDNDHDLDLYVGGRIVGRLFRNEGGSNFVEIPSAVLGKTGVNGVAWADYDNDGDLDLYLARDLNSSRLMRNDSTPGVVTFTDMFILAVRDPGAVQGVVWIDYDNDADLDIFLAKAGSDNTGGSPNRMIRNNGGDSFTDVSDSPVVAVANSRGVAAGDYNGDGYMDLYVANWGSSNQLLQNTYNGVGAHWIDIRLAGTQSNSHGIGARVRLVSSGKTQHREVTAGSGIYSMNAPRAHFGLTTQATQVDTIQVTWPSGIVTDTTGLAVDQHIVLYEEPQQVGIPEDGTPKVARLLAASPNPFRAGTTIAYDLIQASPVRVFVVDPAGRLLRVLESTDLKDPGHYAVQWDGKGADGRPAAKGVYFYSLSARDFRQSFPVILLR